MTPFLRFVDVHKRLGGRPVLRGVRLDVPRGSTVVVLGGSGSGKSVLLRHAIGLHRPDAGEVWVEDLEIGRLEEEALGPVRKKVAMLFQAGALFDSMSVLDNVAFGLREHTDWDEAKIRARVEEVLDLVELDEILDVMPSELSGGMRKRVALARAVAMAPSAILYDEPTTGLDPVTAGAINRLIRELQRRLGVTSVVVTHDIRSAFAVADRIAFLEEGRIAFEGDPAEARASTAGGLFEFLREAGHATA